MSRGPNRGGLPYAMGDVSPLGDVVTTTTAVIQRIADHGAQAVLVSAADLVRLMPPNKPETDAALARHPTWHAGTFDATTNHDDLRESIVRTYQENLHRVQAPVNVMDYA